VWAQGPAGSCEPADVVVWIGREAGRGGFGRPICSSSWHCEVLSETKSVMAEGGFIFKRGGFSF